jgi:hypothetical protein
VSALLEQAEATKRAELEEHQDSNKLFVSNVDGEGEEFVELAYREKKKLDKLSESRWACARSTSRRKVLCRKANTAPMDADES